MRKGDTIFGVVSVIASLVFIIIARAMAFPFFFKIYARNYFG
jgi:hypothetical protein